MHLTLIKNPDESKIISYKITRVVYAETNASSLSAVEAMVSMIANICMTSKQELIDIIQNKDIFESLNDDFNRHKDLLVDATDRVFQMCLRVVQRMLNGDLCDKCCGATKFHRGELLPDWAVSRGYIAEIDDLLFYL
jgi:hypothetical protein